MAMLNLAVKIPCDVIEVKFATYTTILLLHQIHLSNKSGPCRNHQTQYIFNKEKYCFIRHFSLILRVFEKILISVVK